MANHSQSDRAPGLESRSLIGREREQGLLRDTQDAALNGQGGVVLISGGAGIGKTALVNTLAEQATEHGVLVLRGHSYDLTITPPYGPWIEIIETYQQQGETPPLPPSLAGADAIFGLQNQNEFFREIRNFLSTISDTRPVMIVLEDLHWADQASMDLLRFLGRQISHGQRLLMAVTYRDDEVTRKQPLYQLLPLIVREANAGRIDLGELDFSAVQQMVQTRYHLSPTDEARLVAHLYEQAGGNPLYLGELMRALEAEGVLQHGPDAWKLAHVHRTRTPPLVRQVIERRLERLGARSRALLEVAAIIDQTVAYPLWQTVSGASDDELNRAVEEAVEAYVLKESLDGTQLQFTHALVRETLYESVMLPRRQTHHKRVAEALVQSPGTSPDTVAHHFGQAGDERASEWLIRAGDAAYRSWAWIVAAERFDAAEKMLDNRDDMLQERSWLLLKLALVRRGIATQQAIADAERALRNAKHLEDKALEAFATFHLGGIRYFAGENGLVQLEQGAKALEELSEPDVERLKHYFPRSDVAHGVADVLLMQSLVGRYREALSGSERYLARGRPQVDYLWPEQGHAEAACAYALCALGRPDEARLAFRRAQDCYRRPKMVWLGALVLTVEMQYLTLAYESDDLERRQRLSLEIENLWAQSGGTQTQLEPRYGLLPALVVEGHWEEARELALPFANNDIVHHYLGLWALGIVARGQGDVQRAWTSVNTVLPDGSRAEPGSKPIPSILEVQRLAADLALDAGNTELATEWIQAHDRWIELGGRVHGRAEARLLHARFHRTVGDRTLARTVGQEALAHASEPRQPLALIAVHRFLGELDLTAGEHLSAAQHLQQSLDLATACSAPYEEALTLISLAELRGITGEPSDALTLLVQAAAICEPLGALPALDRITTLRQRFDVPPRSPMYPVGLTAREVDVLRLVAEGMSDAEVGERLYISRRTVTSHLTSIYNKLGVSSRAAATRFAVEQGLVA